MYIAEWLVFGVSVVVTAIVLVVLWRVLRGEAKRRLLARARYVLCDASDGVGISVLYCGAGGIGAIIRLLDVGYVRYEVVTVVDSLRDRMTFDDLTERYSLVRVSHTLCREIPTAGVRGLYRSRKRCYRRLVVVDKGFSTVIDGLNAAAGVATYDYVMPMREGWQLMPNAVERMVAELSEHPMGAIDLVRSSMGVPAVLMSREAVVTAGGFACKPWRSVPRARRCTIYEPLLCARRCSQHTVWGGRLLWAGVLVAGVVATAVGGLWMLCALLLTAGVAWSAVCVAAPFVSRGAGGPIDTLERHELLFRKFNVKNFTISDFVFTFARTKSEKCS